MTGEIIVIGKLLGSIFDVWKIKESRKYFEEYRDHLRIIDEEYRKPMSEINMLAVDRSKRELVLLGDRVATEFKRSNAAD